MIKFKDWICSSIDKYLTEDNLAFEIEFEGQKVPFYNYEDKYLSPCSPSRMDNCIDSYENRTSRRLLKTINEKMVNEDDDYHFGLVGGYYTSTFVIDKVKNMCMNCKHTYAFGTDWDIRCEKGGLEDRKDNFIGKYNRNCCKQYEY